MQDQRIRRLFLLVFSLAVIVRLLGIWHGYPYSFYPDEAHFVKRALSFGSFDFNPHWFHKPAFFMYVLFFEYGLFFLFGKISGMWNSVTAFAVSFIDNPGPFYLIGRITTVLFSLGSIAIVYKIGEQYFEKHTGIIAALLLSLCYGHVSSSQDIKADTPAMFFAILSMLWVFKYITDGKKKTLLFSAVFAGIGTATKLYPIMMIIPITLSIGLVQREITQSRRPKNFVISMGQAALVFLVAYFICSPYSFIDPLGRKSTFSFLYSLWGKMNLGSGGEMSEDPSQFISNKMSILDGTRDYLQVLLSYEGMGIVIGIIALSGVIALFFHMNGRNLLLLSYPVCLAVVSVLKNPGYAETRHQIPLYPFLVIAGAALIVKVAQRRNMQKNMIYFAVFLFLLHPLYQIVQRGAFVAKEDTRNIAKEWIETNIDAGTKILIDENGPRLDMSTTNLRKMAERAERADSDGQFTAHYDTYLEYQLIASQDSHTYDLHEIRFPWWRERELKEGSHTLDSEYDRDMGNPLKLVGVESLDYYIDNGFEYVIVNSFRYDRFIEDTETAIAFPSFKNFYRELFKNHSLVKEFSPAGLRPGPTIRVYRLEVRS